MKNLHKALLFMLCIGLVYIQVTYFPVTYTPERVPVILIGDDAGEGGGAGHG